MRLRKSILAHTSRPQLLKILGILTIVFLNSHLICRLYLQFPLLHLKGILKGIQFLNLKRAKESTFVKPEPSVLSSSAISKFVTVFSQVGEYHLTLEGYTSPFALVELSTGLFTVTELRTADKTGYFKFESILLHSFLSSEPCLIATDKSGVSTPPLCLSAIPKGKDVFIKGIILAPSLVLEKGQEKAKKTTVASGYTTPDSTVELFLFREEKKRFFLIGRAFRPSPT